MQNSKKWLYHVFLYFKLTNFSIKYIVEAAFMIALTVIIRLFTKAVSMAFWPQGGNIGFWMLPLILFAARWSLKHTFIFCLSLGLIELIINGTSSPNPYDIIIENVIGFWPFCLPCFFKFLISSNQNIFKRHKISSRSQAQNRPQIIATWRWYLFFILSTSISGLCYFTITFIAGVLFYSSYAPIGTGVYVYSFVYNITYLGPSILLTIIILLLGKNQFKRIIQIPVIK